MVNSIKFTYFFGRISKFFVRKAMENLKTKEKLPHEEKSVLEKLLEIDENVAVIMASDMLFAGVDTVSKATIFLIYSFIFKML